MRLERIFDATLASGITHLRRRRAGEKKKAPPAAMSEPAGRVLTVELCGPDGEITKRLAAKAPAAQPRPSAIAQVHIAEYATRGDCSPPVPPRWFHSGAIFEASLV
jgi:hypothetical protein